MHRIRHSALSAVALVVFWNGAALADSGAPTDEQKAAARMLGTDGVKLALSGDCPGAVDKLSRAEALVHAPTTALPLAQCDIKLGKLVAGTEILNRVVHEPLAPTAPKSWTDAKQQAQTLLDATAPRIPKLRIHIDRPPGATGSVQVAVDGESVPTVLLDNDRPTDPGMHHVTASADGVPPAAADVSLTEGQTQSVALRVDASPTPAAAAAPGASQTPAPVPETPTGEHHGPNRVPAYVLWGVGGAGIVVGSIFGIAALNAKNSLNSACSSNQTCPSSSQGDIDAYKVFPHVSTIGFSVGIIAAAVGTILFFTAHGDEAPKTARLEVRPWLAPGSAGLGGSFP